VETWFGKEVVRPVENRTSVLVVGAVQPSARMFPASQEGNAHCCRDFLSVFSLVSFVAYYAALLPRRGPHIASHSVCLSVCPSVRPSRYRCVTSRHLANYNDTHVLYGTH